MSKVIILSKAEVVLHCTPRRWATVRKQPDVISKVVALIFEACRGVQAQALGLAPTGIEVTLEGIFLTCKVDADQRIVDADRWATTMRDVDLAKLVEELIGPEPPPGEEALVSELDAEVRQS